MSEQAELGTAPTYILSMDLGEKLEAFRRVGIDAPGPHDNFTKDLQQEIASALGDALPKVSVDAVYMTDLSDQVIGVASEMSKQFNDPLIVSSCPEIAYPAGGQELQINRLVNLRGEQIGLGPRPGYPSIDQQVRHIRNVAEMRDVAIVEDGIFSGGTVRHIIKKFRDEGVNVRAVITGFNCATEPDDWYEQSCVDLVTVRPYEKIHDWVPDHDFIPFIPGNGKVLGADLGNDTLLPYYDHRNATYAIPYIQPFGPIEKWASIPDEPGENIATFSGRCLKVALELFREIEKRNQRQITIGDVIHTRQRSSIPIALEARQFPRLQTRIVNYLSESV